MQECPLLPKGGIILISPSHISVSREPIKIMPFTENCDSRAHIFKHYAKLLLKSALIIYNKISFLLLHVIPSMTSRGETDSEANSSKAKKTLPSMSPSFKFSGCREGLLRSPNNMDEILWLWVILDATKTPEE